MKRSKIVIVACCVVLTAISCGSRPKGAVLPETVTETPAPETVEPAAPPPEEEVVFDPNSISRELFDSTKIDVQRFIGDLNAIIQGKNYSAWKKTLSPGFLAEISSRQYLQHASESVALKSRGIVLRSPEDYFTHVVIPSRANSRVDDIEFVSQTRVKAFTINSNGLRLRLYDLEKTGNTWLIIN